MYALRVVAVALLFIAPVIVDRPAADTDHATTAASAVTPQLGLDAVRELPHPKVPQSDRTARFHRLLVDRFAMAAISKFVLGRYWRSTNEVQRVEFQRLFVDFIIGSYSVRFSEYLGEGVQVTAPAPEMAALSSCTAGSICRALTMPASI